MKHDNELFPFRRHLRKCRFFKAGRREVGMNQCKCPFHVDGVYNGQRVRGGLGTRNQRVAEHEVAKRMAALDEEQRNESRVENQVSAVAASLPSAGRTVTEAISSYLRTHGHVDPNGRYAGDSEYGTFRKYKHCLACLSTFCEGLHISEISRVDLDLLEQYRSSRSIGRRTWIGEVQMLRTFLGYCVRHKWLPANPAKDLKLPNVKPNEIVPYTLREESLILAACDRIGGGKYHRSGASYEQLRSRAMIMLLRHTALRISDVSTLPRDAVSWDVAASMWRVRLRTQKTGEPVFLPIPGDLKLVLDALPLPRNAVRDCPYFFWNGVTSRRAVVGIAERTLAAVFRESGVKNAHAHRYRHTLATRLLEQGATFELVADVLGNTPEIVRKHYGKWSPGRQANIDRHMLAHFGTAVAGEVTQKSHEKTEALN